MVASAPGQDARVHTLHPGDVACGERGDRFETLLGSCVAIVLTDPRRTIGAMCHIVHSVAAAESRAGSTAHAEAALDAMYQLLRKRSINPRLCEAYVYGGANMFPQLAAPLRSSPSRHVGASNARWAIEALAHEGIPVLLHDLGGTNYRRLSWTVGPQAPRVVAASD